MKTREQIITEIMAVVEEVRDGMEWIRCTCPELEIAADKLEEAYQSLEQAAQI